MLFDLFFFSSRRRHTRCALVSGVQTCALPILHDIPNTVAKAIQALHGLQPAILTVHAAGGRAMLEDAKAAASAGTKVVAVTVLTSLDGNDLNDIGVMCPPHNQVERLTELARSAGLDGIVCSGHEVSAARQLWPDGYFVVPGVRPPDGKKGDQKRSVTPRQAEEHTSELQSLRRITYAVFCLKKKNKKK